MNEFKDTKTEGIKEVVYDDDEEKLNKKSVAKANAKALSNKDDSPSELNEENLKESKEIVTNPGNNIIGKDNDEVKLNKKSVDEAWKKMEEVLKDNKAGISKKKSILDTKSEK